MTKRLALATAAALVFLLYVTAESQEGWLHRRKSMYDNDRLSGRVIAALKLVINSGNRSKS